MMADVSQLSDENLRQLLAHALQDSAPTSVPNVDANLPPGMPPWMGAFLIGAGKSATRIGQGIRQMLPGDNTALDQQVASENALYAPLAKAHPWATGLGESLPAAAIPIGGAASIPITLGKAAVAAALPGALEYGTPLERAQRAAIGGAAGAAGAGVGYGLGRLATPIRSANPLATDETVALANQAGIKLTPAQATGSKALSSLEGTLGTFPGSAGYMAKLQQAQREGFNRAAMSAIGEPPVASIANDAAQLARQGIGGRIQDAAKTVTVDLGTDQVINDLAQVETKYMRNLTSDQKPFVRNAIDDILKSDSIPGDTYQAWRSRIGARAQGTSDSEFKGALKGIQQTLDTAFMNSAGPDAAAAMTAARGQYRNFKTLEPLIEKAAMTSSNIPPAQVMSRALATGNTQGPMQSLAQLGQTMGREYPNSGTAPRMLWQSIFENPLRALNPLASIGGPTAWLTARAMNSRPGNAYLTNSLMTPEIERLLMRGGGLLGYGAGNVLGPGQ
jgi:hypothetical protein